MLRSCMSRSRRYSPCRSSIQPVFAGGGASDPHPAGLKLRPPSGRISAAAMMLSVQLLDLCPFPAPMMARAWSPPTERSSRCASAIRATETPLARDHRASRPRAARRRDSYSPAGSQRLPDGRPPARRFRPSRLAYLPPASRPPASGLRPSAVRRLRSASSTSARVRDRARRWCSTLGDAKRAPARDARKYQRWQSTAAQFETPI